MQRLFGKKLRSPYERKTAQNKAFIARKLVNLKLKEGKSIAEHLVSSKTWLIRWLQ